MSVFVKINSFSNIFDLNRKILPCFKRKQGKWIRRFGNHENMSWTCYYSKIIVTCIYLDHRMQQPITKLQPSFSSEATRFVMFVQDSYFQNWLLDPVSKILMNFNEQFMGSNNPLPISQFYLTNDFLIHSSLGLILFDRILWVDINIFTRNQISR